MQRLLSHSFRFYQIGDIIGYASKGDRGLTANTTQTAPLMSRAPRTGPDQVSAYAQVPPSSNQPKAGPLSSSPPILHPQELQPPILETTQANMPHDFTRWPEIDLSDPAPLTVYNSLETQPAPEARRGIDDRVVFTSLSRIPGGWNGWPSGLFAMDVSHDEFKQTKKLQVHWATRNNGGDVSGSETAPTIGGGKVTNRRCLGVVRCENPDCKVICRPGTNPAIRRKQLDGLCRWEFGLKHFDCPSRSYLIQWSGGYRYVNGELHNHSRLTYILHMTRSEELEFKELVETHPNLGPAALMLGPRRLDGYGKGAADISEATRHPDRVKYERHLVKSRTMAESGHWFLSQFAEWQRKHPGLFGRIKTQAKSPLFRFRQHG